jgi:Bacterial Ig domain
MLRIRTLLPMCAAAITIYAGPGFASSATFLQMDTTTLGNWKGVYGQDGNMIAQHSVLVPSYSTFNPQGVNLMLYDLWSTDPRALLKQYYSYSATERVASWFDAIDTMDFPVSATDGQSHRIALYFCDFDYQGRSVTVEAMDSATGAVYDTRSLTNYEGGIYLVYSYSGTIDFRIINNNPGQYNPTGSVSAFFWGGGNVAPPPPPPTDTTPPTVSIQTPTGGTVSGTVNITSSAQDNVGVAGVQYQLDGSSLGGEQQTAPYVYAWNTASASNGSHVLTAIASDAAGNRTTSAAVTVTVSNTAPSPGTSGNTVSYLGMDTTTLGNWKGVYGQDGNVIAQHSVLVPSYSTFDPRGVSLMLYDLWSTDPRALLKQYYSYSPTERVASYFQVIDSMDFLVSATDGQTHRIALYFCDFDRAGRSITVEAVDPGTNAVLDTRPLTNYSNGNYLIYNYSGQIIFRVINNNPGQYNPTATLCALFWGGSGGPASGGTAPDTTPPTVSIATPASGNVSGTVQLTATASDASGVSGVQYMIDGSKLGPVQTAAPYTYSWDTTTASNGTHNLSAVATDGAGNAGTSTAIAVNVDNGTATPPPPPPSGNSATFLGIDSKTQGNWKGVYGQDGNFIAQSSYDSPAYSTFNPINVNQLLVDIWSTDPRAPLKYQYAYAPTERVISQWYNRYYMDFQLSTADNQLHRIALYFCDWQPLAPVAAFPEKRSITVQAVNTDTGAVFDTETLTDYTNGLYLVYNYKGNVTFHIVNNYDGDRSLPNANVSAFFWGGSGLPQ